MQEARMLGNYAHYLAESKGVSDKEICSVLNCSETDLHCFYKGRSFITFEQISNLANLLDTSIDRLLEGDEQHYNRSVVQCMNPFTDPENREMILDLIDDYLDVKELVEVE